MKALCPSKIKQIQKSGEHSIISLLIKCFQGPKTTIVDLSILILNRLYQKQQKQKMPGQQFLLRIYL